MKQPQIELVSTFVGTYLYTEKSSVDHSFQKSTYTDQKKRNLVRPLVFVTTTGHILYVAHPYLARNNDATSLKHFFGTNVVKCQLHVHNGLN